MATILIRHAVPCLAAAVFTVSAHGQCAYDTFVLTKDPTWSTFSPVAISNDGTVVGLFVLPSGPAYHAFKWHPSTGHVELPMPAGVVEAEAQALNENGVVAGRCKVAALGSWGPSMLQLAHWDGLVPFSPPPTDPPNGAYVTGVDPEGRVVGYFSAGPLQGNAFLFVDGQFAPVAPELAAKSASFIECVSDAGWYGGRWVEKNNVDKYAFVASFDGAFLSLPSIEGYINPTMAGLTVRLHGVIHAKLPPSARFPFGLFRTFYWNGSQAIDIGLPPGTEWTSPSGVNDVDQIVGMSNLANFSVPNTPFLWQNDVMTDLREQIALPPQYLFQFPMDINDSGVILGVGKHQPSASTVALILTPQTVDEDVNLDCVIDAKDLSFVLEAWGPVAPSTVKRADIDKTGTVDGADIALVLGAWSSVRR